MSQNSQSHSVSLLSFRSIVGGVFVTLSLFLSLMALVALFSDWNFDLSEMPTVSPGFWAFTFAAWILSVFGGALIASWSIAPRTLLSSTVNSVVTWAASCLFVTTVLTLSTNAAFNFTQRVFAVNGPFWTVFVGNTIALGVSLMAATTTRGRRRESDEPASPNPQWANIFNRPIPPNKNEPS